MTLSLELNIWELNVEVLRSERPELYEHFVAVNLAEEETKASTEATKSGLPNLSIARQDVSGTFYSRYQPLVEAERWASGFADVKAEAIAFLGLGLGYHIRALRQAVGSEKKIVVIEPSWSVFAAALETVDLTDLFKDENLFFLIESNIKELARRTAWHISDSVLFNAEWIEWPAFRRMHGDLMEEFAKVMSQSMKNIRLDQNTMIYFQRYWPRNMLRNLSTILQNPGLIALAGKFSRRPAIIVSAGPSLAKNVDLLHEVKGKALILCVDTAYRVLQQKGIQPDLIFALDGSEKNYRHFTGVTPEGVPLVFVPTVNHKIVEEYGKRSFSVNTFDSIIYEAVKHAAPKGAVGLSGSVATLAFSAANLMDADPIIFIGQDLAYPGGQAYAPGTMFEGMTKSEQDSSLMKFVDGIDGEPVLTDEQLDIFRRWFEGQIEVVGEKRRFIDATEGGAKIHGTEIMTLREAADLYCSESFAIQEVIDKAAEPVEEDLKPALEVLRTMRRTLHQLKRLARIALIKNEELRTLYKVRRLRTSKVAKVSAELDRIEERINLCNQKKWLDTPLQHLLLIVTQGKLSQAPDNETEHAKAMRITENAELLYMGMLEAANELKENVQLAIDDLEKVTKLGEND